VIASIAHVRGFPSAALVKRRDHLNPARSWMSLDSARDDRYWGIRISLVGTAASKACHPERSRGTATISPDSHRRSRAKPSDRLNRARSWFPSAALVKRRDHLNPARSWMSLDSARDDRYWEIRIASLSRRLPRPVIPSRVEGQPRSRRIATVDHERRRVIASIAHARGFPSAALVKRRDHLNPARSRLSLDSARD